jgi:hypothetical protein
LKQIGILLRKQDIYLLLQDNAYNSAKYPSKEAYLQNILQNLMSRNLLTANDMAFVKLCLQYMKEPTSVRISGEALSDILRHIVHPSDEREKKLFDIVNDWLSKANIVEVLGDYKIDLATPAEKILKLILRFALTNPQFTYRQQLHQILPLFVSKISPSNTATNAEGSVEGFGIERERWKQSQNQRGRLSYIKEPLT